MLKAVILDMDGVIIDSERIGKEALLNSLKYYKLEKVNLAAIPYRGVPNDVGRKLISQKITEYYPDFNVELFFDFANKNIFNLIENKAIPLIPHTKEFLIYLKRNKILTALASSNKIDIIKLAISMHELNQYFNIIVSIDNVEHGKPAPDIFLYAYKQLGIEKNQCIVIEDSISGVQAARSSGIKCIGFNQYDDQDLSGCDLIITSLKELDMDIINKILL